MKSDYQRHIIPQKETVKSALEQLDKLASNAILFVTDGQGKLLGSLTDGDIRRGLIKGLTLDDDLLSYLQPNPKYIKKGSYSIEDIIEYRKQNILIIPIVDEQNTILNVVNLKEYKSYLPLDAVIMAGGRGSRLAPLTDTVPKPLLKIGDKPIIEHNIDNLQRYGIDDIWISIKYLGDQIVNYFGDGSTKNLDIQYIEEQEPLGTAGALSLAEGLKHDYVLLTNSDLLTNLDYEDFFLDFINKGADFSVLSIPYNVDVPYAVLETESNQVRSFQEKPTYTYYANGGIYIFRREMLDFIPKNEVFNATDFMNALIDNDKKVITYPFANYWLDIGKPNDYEKAQRDINQIKL